MNVAQTFMLVVMNFFCFFFEKVPTCYNDKRSAFIPFNVNLVENRQNNKRNSNSNNKRSAIIHLKVGKMHFLVMKAKKAQKCDQFLVLKAESCFQVSH